MSLARLLSESGAGLAQVRASLPGKLSTVTVLRLPDESAAAAAVAATTDKSTTQYSQAAGQGKRDSDSETP